MIAFDTSREIFPYSASLKLVLSLLCSLERKLIFYYVELIITKSGHWLNHCFLRQHLRFHFPWMTPLYARTWLISIIKLCGLRWKENRNKRCYATHWKQYLYRYVGNSTCCKRGGIVCAHYALQKDIIKTSSQKTRTQHTRTFHSSVHFHSFIYEITCDAINEIFHPLTWNGKHTHPSVHGVQFTI